MIHAMRFGAARFCGEGETARGCCMFEDAKRTEFIPVALGKRCDRAIQQDGRPANDALPYAGRRVHF